MNDTASSLTNEVVKPLKGQFVGRDEVIDLIALAVVAGEHLFLYGPPGTAKSALIRRFANAVDGSYFEYMLTRFSEPNEIFGPIDIAKLREGEIATITDRMLPTAEFAFLDEIFNANSAILNNLLTVLNERNWRRGAEVHELPLLALFSASNTLPDDDALRALFDRFLLRCHVQNLPQDSMPGLLQAGWQLEHPSKTAPAVSSAELKELAAKLYTVDLSGVAEIYADAVFKVRALGIDFSDRRAVKVQKLLAASALICGREYADASDLWVLRYTWDREEQIAPVRTMVNGILEAAKSESPHALAGFHRKVDPEQVASQLDGLDSKINAEPTLAQLAQCRDELASLSDQCTWIENADQRAHLASRVREMTARVS
ncbi:MAG: AAA family ATPase [Planctomycetota bacterium]|jgi:MoxR-like ATPase